jgi:hypothetical protein
MVDIQTICQTAFGKFRIRVDDKQINVGGKTFCVNIALYENVTTLYWLKTDEGGCEVNEKEIENDTTIKMTDLAFSLLRKYYPERTQSITLLDDSGFSWQDKKGKKYKTNFLKGYLLLHQKTWYEDKFNATMCDPEIYSKYREKAEKNFDDPNKKPESFNFMNSEVKEKLDPLYKSSKTWGEFINKIKETYNEEKYKLIHDWYRQAIYIIFDGMEINQDWKIDISKRPYIECNQQGGAAANNKSKTRKNRRITFSKYNRLEPFSWNPQPQPFAL